MPQNVESLILGLDERPEGECKLIPLNCPWTLTSKDERLAVILACLNWTFNYGFCVRLIAHPEGTPNVSKQLDPDDHHPLLISLIDALYIYETFPEPHLNTHQLDIVDDIMEYLDLNFNWNILASTYLA